VKHKRKAILVLVVIMLMGAMLTGCRDRDNNTNSPTETNQSDLYREREDFHREMEDPNRPPPERNGTQSEQNYENANQPNISEQNAPSNYLLETPLSFEQILDLLDDFENFEAYISYLASVRGLGAYYHTVFRFERLPGGRVVNTPLANVIAMYEEMSAAFEFVSLGSHHFLGYLGNYTHGADFMRIPLGSSVEAEMNRWVENDGHGNSFYYTPLKAMILSASAFHRFDGHIASGRNLQASDSRISRNEPISILLGAAYKGIYELGDILTLHYINIVMDFQVVGFLNPDVDFWFGLGAHENVLLDYRIVMPQFIPDFEPVGGAEIWTFAFHIGELLSGFIAIESAVSEIREEYTWLQYKEVLEDIAARHSLSDIVGIDVLPFGIIWPR
jgi:hypothetical protein